MNKRNRFPIFHVINYLLNRASIVGLWSGLALSVLVFLATPDTVGAGSGDVYSLSMEGRIVLSLLCLMAVWWISEAIPIYVTALLPLFVLPVFGIQNIAKTAAPYGHQIIFLVLSGFAIAAALEKWDVHKKFALAIISVAGHSPGRIVAAFMLTSALLSMWISNTATAILMLPCALSLIDSNDRDLGESPNFPPCLLLAICYACSMGGMTTLTGTTTNMFFAGYMDNELGRPVEFVTWMLFSVPVAIVMLLTIWTLLTFILFPVQRRRRGGYARKPSLQAENVRWSKGAVRTAAVFICVAVSWISLPLITEIPGLEDLNMYVVGMAGLFALFLIPSGSDDRTSLLDWDTTLRKVPWGILFLVGGGLSLASAVTRFGVSEFLAIQVAGMTDLPLFFIFLIVVGLMIFLTEVTTNVASVTALTPVFASVAISLNVDPSIMVALLTLAASCAFMLPVATPPNAIVFGSERIKMRQMARAGVILNVLAILIVTTWSYFSAERFFGA